MVSGKTAMVCRDATGRESAFLHAFRQVPGDPFREAAGVDKNQGGVVFGNEISQAVVDLAPDFGRHDRLKG